MPTTRIRPTTHRSTTGVSGATVKGVKATPAQVRDINAILAEAKRLGASRRVLIACIMAATQESVIKPLRHGDKPGPDSRGYYQQRSGWGPEADRLDPAKSTKLFLTGGKGGQPGWKQKHGSLKNALASLDSMITRVQVSNGGYGQWEPEATKTVDAWLKNPTDGGSADGEDAETTRRKPYKYSRAADEDSWTAIQRLAEEVNWRAYSVNGKFYYASDKYLLSQKAVATITPTDPAILDDFAFDVDEGAEVNEISFTCLADRWGLAPGRVVAVREAGVANGRWLIKDTSRSLFEDQVSVTLVSERRTKKEPAPETVTTSNKADSEADSDTAGTGEGADAVYAMAVAISKKNYGYSWGGGHERAGYPSRHPNSSRGGPLTMGYDCSGYVAACLVAGGYFKKGAQVGASGGFGAIKGAKPGKGKNFTVWYNAGHTFIEFHGKRQFKSADTRRITNKAGGPHVHTAVGQTAGFSACHF